MTNTPYLDRPLVQGITYTISDDEIKISCSHTMYCHMRLYNPKHTQADLMALYKAVYRQAKEAGTSVSFKLGYKRTLKDRWTEYEQDTQKSQEIFKAAQSLALHIRDDRGIHMGSRDDEQLERLEKLQFQHQQLFYRNTAISCISDIAYRLKDLQSDMNRRIIYDKICL